MQLASNVIELRRPSKAHDGPPPPPASLAFARSLGRTAWEKAVRAYWANPDSWGRCQRGDVIKLESGSVHTTRTEVTIERERGGDYWVWMIWQRDREFTKSQWIYVSKQDAFDAALEAVIAVV